MRSAAGWIQVLAGLLLVVIGALGMIGAVAEYTDGKQRLASAVALFILFVVMTAGGAWLLWTRSRRGPQAASASPEQRVLDLAESRKGRVTVEEVAAHCDLSLERSKQLLDRLAVSRVARMQVTDSGVLVYHFPGFLSPQEKEAATDF